MEEVDDWDGVVRSEKVMVNMKNKRESGGVVSVTDLIDMVGISLA